MTEEKDNIFVDETMTNDISVDVLPADDNIPEAYRNAQTLLDRFVTVNYETAVRAYESTPESRPDINSLRNELLNILRDNPPLASILLYLRDGIEDYLWYSDFYDDAHKDVMRQYATPAIPQIRIIPANYTEELSKITLPYFRELVNLVGLIKLIEYVEERIPAEEDTESQYQYFLGPQHGAQTRLRSMMICFLLRNPTRKNNAGCPRRRAPMSLG